MSGYNVTTPRLFNVKDPVQLLQFNLNTLNSTFSFPDDENQVQPTGNGYWQITAGSLLDGYIICTGAGNGDVFVDDATTILTQVQNKMQGLTNFNHFSNGFSFQCILHNSSTGSLSIYSNGSVKIGGSQPQIASDATAILEIIVLDQARLNDVEGVTYHQDKIFICVSRCATAIAPTSPQ